MRKKQILLIFIIIVILVFFIMLWQGNRYYEEKNNSIEIISNYSSDISLKDSFPMSDENGKYISYDLDNSAVQGYYEFEIISKDKDTNFEIYAVEQYYEHLIHPNYIKIFLTDEYNNPIDGYNTGLVPTFYTLKLSSVNPIGKRIYYGKIKSGEKQKFILRTWVADAYSIGTVEKNFGIKINVEAD